MATTPPSYLHECWESFRAVSQAKYGMPFDLPAIEQSVKHLRRHTTLCYEDLRSFEAPEQWWFAKYWVFPPDNLIAPALRSRPFNFWRLPDGETETIADLLEIFKSIELVSIVLRFIRPEHYGILSPPVERILDVRRGSDAVETYLNYTNDLRRIAARYHFTRAADADMALWVLHEYCFGALHNPRIHEAYVADSFMLGLRLENRMGDIFRGPVRGELIRGLAAINIDLAGQIGGIAFERMVRTKARDVGIIADEAADLSVLIDALYDKNVIDSMRRGQWHAARRTRNKAIHQAHAVAEIEIRRLLEQLE